MSQGEWLDVRMPRPLPPAVVGTTEIHVWPAGIGWNPEGTATGRHRRVEVVPVTSSSEGGFAAITFEGQPPLRNGDVVTSPELPSVVF